MLDFLKDDLEPLSYLIYALSVFILLNQSKSTKNGVLFVYYLLASISIMIACNVDVALNRLIYNVFFFVTICVFTFYFKSVIPGKIKQNIINIIFIVHLVLFLKICFTYRQLFEINNYVYGITYLSIVVYALLYFESVLRNINELNMLHQFDFWLVSGYLLYFLSCFFIILFYENVEVKQRAIVWSLQNIILFLSSVIAISGSIWISYRKKYY